MQRTHDDKPLSRPLREHLRFRRRLHQTSASRPHGSTVGGPHFWSGASRQTSLATRHLGAASAPEDLRRRNLTLPMRHSRNCMLRRGLSADLRRYPCTSIDVLSEQHRAQHCEVERGHRHLRTSQQDLCHNSVLHGVRHLPRASNVFEARSAGATDLANTVATNSAIGEVVADMAGAAAASTQCTPPAGADVMYSPCKS